MCFVSPVRYAVNFTRLTFCFGRYIIILTLCLALFERGGETMKVGFVKRGGETVKPQVPEYCLFQGCYNPDYERETAKCKKKCSAYNKLAPGAKKRRKKILRSLLGKTGELFVFLCQLTNFMVKKRVLRLFKHTIDCIYGTLSINTVHAGFTIIV